MNAFLTTFEFLSPLSFTAVLLIIIPLVIHLLNPRKERVINVGNIDFFRSSSIKKLNQVKLRKIILLLTRLLLVLLLAMILAQPFAQLSTNQANQVQYYFSYKWLTHSDESQHEQIESLVAKASSKYGKKTASAPNNKRHMNHQRFILLDDFGKNFSSFGSLLEHAKNQKQTTIRPHASRNNLHHLLSRENNAKSKHIFVTNSASSFGAKLPNLVTTDKHSITVLNIEDKNKSKEVSISVHLPIDEVELREYLSASLSVLSKLSDTPINISFEETSPNANFDFSQYDSDVIHIIGNSQSKTKLNSTTVVPAGEKAVLEMASTFSHTLDSTQPEEVIIYLSNLLDKTTPLSKNNVASIEPRDFESQDFSVPLDSPLKSLKDYFILLFCLFWLVERWIVIGNRKRKVIDNG